MFMQILDRQIIITMVLLGYVKIDGTFLSLIQPFQNDCFMEITEAFQNQPSSAKSPKKSTNCNGHSMQGYCDGEISFIPLQERGISIKGISIP